MRDMLYRFVIAGAIAASACGQALDDRPANLAYITEAVLAPSCGSATCHSSFRQENGLAFDTVEGARASFQGDPILIRPSNPDDPRSPPGLMLNLTIEQPGAPRMPYYEPLPDHDLDLIERWLGGGATGVCVGGLAACLGDTLVPCTDKGAYNLAAIDTPDAPNCAEVGAAAGMDMRCERGACVAVNL